MTHGICRNSLAMCLLGLGCVWGGSEVTAQPNIRYSGQVIVGNPCDLIPAGSTSLCIEQTPTVTAELTFVTRNRKSLVRTKSDGTYSARIKGRAPLVQLRKLEVTFGGLTFTFDPSQFQLTAVQQGSIGKASNVVSYFVRHKKFSEQPSICEPTRAQGITGSLFSENRMPMVCDNGGTCEPTNAKLPIANITIVAIENGTSSQYTTQTDKNGQFSFPHLAAGSYVVYAQYPGIADPLDYPGLSQKDVVVMCDGSTRIELGLFAY